MNIQLIDTGYFYADGGAMFGAIPKTAWSRRYPSNEMNGCVLAMRTVLITTDCGRVILIDNGAGNKHLKQLSYYKFFNLTDLGEELLKRGIHPEEVTDMVLTHLHFDHCGYSTQIDETSGLLQPAFMNATHWVSRSQWNNFQNPNPLEKDSYFPENMQIISECGLLKLIDENTELCPGITLRLFSGHTPGQIVPYIEMSGQTFVFAGDVIPLVAHLSPGWISAYDTFPLQSYQEKLRMLEEAVNENQTIIYCHDAQTLYSDVKKINNFYTGKKSHSILQ